MTGANKDTVTPSDERSELARLRAEVATLRAQSESAAQQEAERRRALVTELNHRMRNTLATIVSLAHQTATRTRTVGDFVAAFQARLMALASAHSLVTRGNGKSASLREVVAEMVMQERRVEPLAISADGPDCTLTARQASALALGLGELLSNARKFGALSGRGGRVAVAWTIDRTERGRSVTLHWTESGGPKVRRPRRRSFGLQMIERALPMDLDGEVKLEFNPAGVRCAMVFALPNEGHEPARIP